MSKSCFEGAEKNRMKIKKNFLITHTKKLLIGSQPWAVSRVFLRFSVGRNSHSRGKSIITVGIHAKPMQTGQTMTERAHGARKMGELVCDCILNVTLQKFDYKNFTLWQILVKGYQRIGGGGGVGRGETGWLIKCLLLKHHGLGLGPQHLHKKLETEARPHLSLVLGDGAQRIKSCLITELQFSWKP